MNQRAYLRVRRYIGVDHDQVLARVTPSARRPRDRFERDRESERVREPLERGEEVYVRIAAQWLARRLKARCVFACGDLGAIEHRDRSEERLALARLLPAHAVSLLDLHRREDPDRPLPLAHRVAERPPGVKPGDERRLRSRERDQQLVVDRVASETVARTDPDPPLPPLRGQELLGRDPQPLAVAYASLLTLLRGQFVLRRHHRLLRLGPAGCGPMP